MHRRAALVLVLFLAAACRRQAGPDASYEKAQQQYQQLYASELDDAYGDPKMDQVVALLKQVNPRSVDAPAAQMLLGTIQRGKDALAKDRAQRAKMAAAAAASAQGVSDIDPVKVLAASAPDAGMIDPYGPGASVAEINAQTGACLVEGEPFTERGTSIAGTVYRLAPSQPCAEKLPGFVGQALLVVGGKVYRRVPASLIPPQPAPDAGAVQQAAANQPPPAPVQKPVFLPDGGPDMQMILPGQPTGDVPPPPPQQ